jgi:hypothetical protein
MAQITVTRDEVRIHFTLGERIGGLIRDQRIPLAAIRGLVVEASPVDAVRGMRAPGLSLPGRRKIGTWRARGHKHLICVRRGQPAVRIESAGTRFDGYLVGADDPERIIAAIRRESPALGVPPAVTDAAGG